MTSLHLFASRVCLISSLVVALCTASEVCYQSLACFTTDYPFGETAERPFGVLPHSPDQIATTFTLYRRAGEREKRKATEATLAWTIFDPNRDTKFIIHGYMDSSSNSWISDMKRALLRADDLNVFVVDWSTGAEQEYSQSASNAQVVGTQIAELIMQLNTTYRNRQQSTTRFHLIGNNLGAHVAGYAGFHLAGKLDRITGLDVSGPFFDASNPAVRLDQTDAEYVDVVHVGASSLTPLDVNMQSAQLSGHVDFFVNPAEENFPSAGGTGAAFWSVFSSMGDVYSKSQKLRTVRAWRAPFVSRFAAARLFTDSISQKCKYAAYACKSYADFKDGKCMTCSTDSGGCNRMGYWSSSGKESGVLYLNAHDLKGKVGEDDDASYGLCKQAISIRLESSDVMGANAIARGRFSIAFETGAAEIVLSGYEERVLHRSSQHTSYALLERPVEIERVDKVFVKYDRFSGFFNSWMYEAAWRFERVEIVDGDTMRSSSFCPLNKWLNSGELAEFRRC